MLVAYGRLQPIIVTLATGSIWTGIALYIRPSPGGFIPLDFSNLLSGTAFAEPVPLPLGLTWSTPIPKAAFVVAGSGHLLGHLPPQPAGDAHLRRRQQRRRRLSLRGQRAARQARRLHPGRSRRGLRRADQQRADGDRQRAWAGPIFTLNSIAAVVLGGAALAGGAGSYLGTLAGAYVIAIIPSVLQFYGVSSFYKDLVQGSILLFAVALGAFGLLRVRNRMDRL